MSERMKDALWSLIWLLDGQTEPLHPVSWQTQLQEAKAAVGAVPANSSRRWKLDHALVQAGARHEVTLSGHSVWVMGDQAAVVVPLSVLPVLLASRPAPAAGAAPDGTPNEVERHDDMCHDGSMRLTKQPNGDIKILAYADWDDWVPVFCPDGASPRTYAALLQLMRAMAEDSEALAQGGKAGE